MAQDQSPGAESEIGDSDHKTDAEEDQTVGEAVENVAGLFREMNVEGQLSRCTISRVWVGDRDFAE